METDDEVLVVIIGGEEESSSTETPVKVNQEVLDEFQEFQGSEVLMKEVNDDGIDVEINVELDLAKAMGVSDLIEAAERHGQIIHMKNEKEDYTDHEYLSEEFNDTTDEEYTPDLAEMDEGDIDRDEDTDMGDVMKVELHKNHRSYKNNHNHRYKLLKPWERKSFVEDLRKESPELREDDTLLIETLCQIMCRMKPPPPAKDYFMMTGDMFECVQCGSLKETLPAIARHWQEKHGERYLICFACGVDFRSTTNLYKHEMRCQAPDAVVVLKARALKLGRKGRGRPFKPSMEVIKLREKIKVMQKVDFACSQCPATFKSKVSLQSHEHAHRGERPFRCRLCPAAYTSKGGLTKHEHIHTGVEFICDHCSKSFNNKNGLIAHLNTHLPVRKWVCSLCGRRFAHRAALRRHADQLHLRLPPPCACRLCPKRYPRMSLLKTHMLKVHGLTIMTKKMFYKSLPLLSERQLKQAKIVMKSEPESEPDPDPEPEPWYQRTEDTFDNERFIEEMQQNGGLQQENNNEIEVEEDTKLSEDVVEEINKLLKAQVELNNKYVIIRDGKVTINEGEAMNSVLGTEFTYPDDQEAQDEEGYEESVENEDNKELLRQHIEDFGLHTI